MGLQISDLVIVALGVSGDTAPIALQPRLVDGIHLRCGFARARGFPWYGYSLFRRPHEFRGERCLAQDFVGRAPRTDLGTRVPAALGLLSATRLFIDGIRRATNHGALYDALNEPGKKDSAALLATATHPDYCSYSTSELWLTRDQLADVFTTLGSVVRDLRWTMQDIQTFGDQIVVRGEATGTPVRELWGAKPTGKSFKTMAIDVFTLRRASWPPPIMSRTG